MRMDKEVGRAGDLGALTQRDILLPAQPAIAVFGRHVRKSSVSNPRSLV